MKRKDALKNIMTLSTIPFVGQAFGDSILDNKVLLNNNINHSVCRWCYNGISLEKLCEFSASIGIKSIDLLTLGEETDIAKKYGLTCAMLNGSPLMIPKGFNNPIYHNQLLKDYSNLIPKAAEQGFKNIICFSGNREKITDEQGLENCAKGLEPVLKIAKKYNVTICMELLNSKVDHTDYHCDHTEWGVKLVEKTGSDHFRLLYDIYHMQIMEGDVISTIRKNSKYIAHYHTGGVPGRNEIDITQELNYVAIMKAIVDTGFKGFVAQEFIPAKVPFESLQKAITLCDV